MKHKTKATTSVSYTTKVIIDKYKNNEKVATYETHNAGTWRLFNALCLAIAQYNISAMVPHYLDIRCIENSSRLQDVGHVRRNNTCLREVVPVSEVTFDLVEPMEDTSKNYEGYEPYPTGECNVYLSFSVYADYLRYYTGNYMVLQDASTSEYILAYVDLCQLGLSSNSTGDENGDGFSLSADEMIAVTWVITFKNGEFEEEEEEIPEDNTGNSGGTVDGGDDDGSGTGDDDVSITEEGSNEEDNSNEEGGD